MAKREIRTQYSGFIVFTAKLLTVATGLIFTLMLTRSVTQPEFGAWGTLNIVIPYFTLLSTAIPFWVTRFVARDKEGASKTGILTNTIIGTAATLVYVVLLPLIITTYKFETYTVLFSVAALQIIEAYLIAVLEACLQAQQPHFVGYGLLCGEVCKVFLGYVFIIGLQLSLLGAILSFTIAFAIRIAFYFKTILKELRKKIVFSYTREWIKGSAFNIYNLIGDRIAAVVFVMLSIYGGETATGYYYAALTIANVITYSSFLAFALYPKILAENKIEEATSMLKMVLMFAIPMAVGAIALADSYLTVLQEETLAYTPAVPVLIILAIDSLILTVSSIFSTVLFGIEKIDEKATIPFKQVTKTRLFKALSLPYAHSLITLPTTFYALTNLAKNQPLLVAAYVTTINTVAHLAMFVVLYIILRKAVKVKIPWRNIAKYVIASAVMGIFLFVIPHPTKISTTLVVTAMGGIIYLGLVLVFDEEARRLAAVMLREFGKRLS